MTASQNSVLFVGAFPEPAALDRYVSGDLALRLESCGWRTRATSRRAGRLARLWDMLWEIWSARRQYEAACVDVFSGPAFLWAEAACFLLRRLGKPYILTLHGGSLPEFGAQHASRVKSLLASAVAVTCPSAYLMAEMRQLKSDLLLLPNGLDLARYAFREPQSPARRLVWLRAFHEIYNPQLAISVLARIREQYPDVRLAMIGPDKGDGSLQKTKELASRLGVQAAVEFTGAVAKQDVPNRLSQGDIFVNTTNFDNTPVSVLEAMACGLPVVTTNVGGIPYMLEDRQTALLTPAGNEAVMCQAVLDLMQDAALAKRLAWNGRKLVETFDWTVILPRWETLLRGMIANAQSPACEKAQTKGARA